MSTKRTSRRALLAAVMIVVVGCCGACADSGGGDSAPATPASSSTSTSATTSAAPRSAAASSSSVIVSTSAAAAPSASSAAARHAAHVIDELTDALGSHGVSVAARDLTTGATFHYGATGGMYEGSISKVDIIETLLLQHQAAHTGLSSTERNLATAMIEHSDNNAANSLWTREGGRDAVAAANRTLGLRHTVPGPGIYWGFSTTDATDQVALLSALVARHGPLDAASQDYILGLMRDVESDQRWGVATVSDDPDDAALKNGWLPNSLDNGRWLVNSLGIVSRDGHTILMAVLTQHGASFDGGIALDEQLARAVLPALRSR